MFLTSTITPISSSGMHIASLTCVTRALVSGVIESWKRDRNSLGLLNLNSSALATYCWISINDCSASSGEDEHFSICCDANRSTPRAHHLFAWNKGAVCVKFILTVFLKTIFSQWQNSVLSLTSLDKLISHASFCNGWSGVGEMAAGMLCACATTLLSEKKHVVSTVIYQTALQQLSVNALRYVDSCHTVPISLPQYADGLL